MNASIPPASGEILSLISLLKDDKKAQSLIEGLEKTKSEIAEGLKANEVKLKELGVMKSEVETEKQRLYLLKKVADESVAEAKLIDINIAKNKRAAEEKLASAEAIEAKAKADAQAKSLELHTKELWLSERRLEVEAALEAAKVLKASYEEKMKKLKNLIGEA